MSDLCGRVTTDCTSWFLLPMEDLATLFPLLLPRSFEMAASDFIPQNNF